MKNWKIAREIVMGSSAVLGISLVTAIVVMSGCTKKSAHVSDSAKSEISQVSEGVVPLLPGIGQNPLPGIPGEGGPSAITSWELKYPDNSGIFTLDSLNVSSAPLLRAPASGYYSVEPELPLGFELDSTTGILKFHAEAFDPKVSGSIALPKGKANAAGSVLIEPKIYTVIFHAEDGEYYARLPIGLQSSIRSLGKLPLRISNAASVVASVVLSDGKILFAGGQEAGGSISKLAYVYSPSLGQVELVKSMKSARSGHAMTLLKDGRVWVSGGVNASNELLSSTEFYDPELKKFSTGPELVVSRTQHSALVLGNGNVLVTGGLKNSDSGLAPIAAVELFKISDKRMMALSAMSFARAGHTATLLSDASFAKVLILGGGQLGVRGALPTGEIFDPRANAWTPVNAATLNRKNHSAVLLSDKRVWIVGGDVDSKTVSSTEFFNYDNLNFSQGPELKEARAGLQITNMGEGRYFVSGGLARDQGVINPTLKTEIWSFAGGISSLSFGSPLESGRSFHLSVLLSSAEVLMIGGDLMEGNNSPSDSITVSAFNPFFPDPARNGALGLNPPLNSAGASESEFLSVANRAPSGIIPPLQSPLMVPPPGPPGVPIFPVYPAQQCPPNCSEGTMALPPPSAGYRPD